VKFEFSKLVLTLVLLTYFVGVGIGAYVTIIDGNQLAAYLTFIGTPTGIAIAFYAWKARAENVIKLQRLGLAQTEHIDWRETSGDH